MRDAVFDCEEMEFLNHAPARTDGDDGGGGDGGGGDGGGGDGGDGASLGGLQ